MNLREAAQQALEALLLSTPKPRPSDDDYAEQGMKEHQAAIKALRAALAETHTSVDNEYTPVKPVAWQWLNTGTFRKRLPKTAVAENWTPLYAAPPQSKPLTIGQLFDLYNEHAKCQQEDWLVSGWLAFALAIERAHGIGEEE